MIQKIHPLAAAALTAFFLIVAGANTVRAESSILLTLMNASQSVVQIESENAQIGRGTGPHAKRVLGSVTYVRTGTGIIIDAKGIIATNTHIVIQAARIRVHTFDGKTYEAKPIIVDRANDLCLLKINPDTELTALPLADVSKVALQSRIYSIGGSNLLRNTLSEGKVTGIAFSKQLKKAVPKRLARDIKLFQINIDLYPGDSGSPIFNSSGQVIGIISAAAQRRGKTAFAVPSSLMIAHLAALTRPTQTAP